MIKNHSTESRNRLFTAVPFLCFFLFLLLQHATVFLYYDDFGYASLSYAYLEEGVQGTSYTFSQMLHYLGQHYLLWGGRVLGFFMELLLLQLGLPVFRFVQSLVIALLFFIIYRFANHGIGVRSPLLPLSVCAFYGLFSLAVYTEGFYWFTASVLYVFPALVLIFGLFLFGRLLCGQAKSGLKTRLLEAACVLLLFVGSFSMEQYGIMAVVAVGGFAAYLFFTDRARFRRGLVPAAFLAVLAGFVILMLSPGIGLRKEIPLYAAYYALPFSEQVMRSFLDLMLGVFDQQSPMLCCSVFLLGAFAGLQNLRSTGKKCLLMINGVTVGFSAVLFFQFAFSFRAFSGNQTINACLYFLYMLLFLISLTQLLLCKKNWVDGMLWCILLGGYASMAGLLVTPAFVARNVIPFSMAVFLILGRQAARFFRWTSTRRPGRQAALICAALVPLLLFSGSNLAEIYFGYRQNTPVHVYNDALLKKAHADLAEGKNNSGSTLFRLKAPAFAAGQGDEVAYWMREYYDLPSDYVITWTPFDESKF